MRKCNMSDLKKLQDAILAFTDERDWDQFHTPKDLVLGLLIEAGELAEHVLYDRTDKTYVDAHREDIEDEFADTFHYLLLIADKYNIDIPKACEKKMEKTKKKYPVEKAKGNPNKYTEL